MNSGAVAAAVVVRVPTQESELRSIRARVVDFVVDHGGDDDVVNDIELAVSELATNVMQHSAAETVTVEIQCLDTGWQIDVHDAETAPRVDHVEAPPTDSVTGRGLFIVNAVMDHVELVEVGGHTIIRCLKLHA